MIGKFSDEKRRELIRDIQNFFYENRGEEIGEIAAGDFLNFVNESLASHYFNAGVDQAIVEVEKSHERLVEELLTKRREVR